MKARINTYAIRQTRLESASLGVLCTVAHPLAKEGKYAGTVFRGKNQVATFQLTVSQKADDSQVDVDLAKMVSPHRQSERNGESSFSVVPKGYLVLYVSEGPGGFHVLLDEPGERRPRRVFDSRSLGKGDVFIASALRPGRYEMQETYAKNEGQMTVNFPKPAVTAYAPAPPERVEVTEDGLDPSTLRVEPAQGVVFPIKTSKASIVVDLKEPDDGPRDERRARGRVRWTNPVPPKK